MVLKGAFAAALCTGFLIVGGPAMADQYRPSEFLGLDLSRAVLSPKRLGPETQFAPVPIEAKADRPQTQETAVVEPKPSSRKTATRKTDVARASVAKTGVAKTRVARHRAHPRAAARAKLARRHHSNPLDAQAMDTRVQTWPCRSGGICNWKR